MLEEVQVPIAFGHRVVNRVPTGDLRVGKAAAGDKVNLDRQRLGLRVEVDFPDEPRIAYAKGCLKQFAMHRSCCSLPETRHDTTHLKFKRGSNFVQQPKAPAGISWTACLSLPYCKLAMSWSRMARVP
ncbi:hypothetical protein D3C86_1717280 [compost metagenome]